MSKRKKSNRKRSPKKPTATPSRPSADPQSNAGTQKSADTDEEEVFGYQSGGPLSSMRSFISRDSKNVKDTFLSRRRPLWVYAIGFGIFAAIFFAYRTFA